MSDTEKINSQDILNAIDLNKINQNEKKRRGRPKKTQMLSPHPKMKTQIIDDSDKEDGKEFIDVSMTDITSSSHLTTNTKLKLQNIRKTGIFLKA